MSPSPANPAPPFFDRTFRVLIGDEFQEFWRALFTPIEQRLAESHIARQRTGWRIIRELARVRGLVSRNQETLRDAAQGVEPSCWRGDFKVFPSRDIDVCDPVVIAMSENPMPLLPIVDGIVPNPDLVEVFVDAAAAIALRLGVDKMAEGRLALPLLINPETAIDAWPIAHELMEFEALEVGRVLDKLLQQTDFEVRRMLQREGYSQAESVMLIAMAKRSARQQVLSDPESDRAMLVIRLQDTIQRAHDEGHAASEIQATRLLAQVQGLMANGEAKDEDVDDMVKVVRRHQINRAPVRPALEP